MTSETGEALGPMALAALYLLLLVPAIAWHLRARRRAHVRAERALREAREDGLTEPASLHPRIDPARCLGCGSCVGACPEHGVLGLVAGRAVLVQPADCIGHGACAAACPFDAITLVLGTERRGVEIPRLGPDFQTEVPGVFVAGELGGMGLIRNAVEQGRQAIESVRAHLAGAHGGNALDVLVVGAGPAGLAASLAARQHGLRCVTIEQETLGGTVAHYPRGKIVMTRPWHLPMHGRVSLRETTREALLELWHEVVRATGIDVRTEERMVALRRDGDVFAVETTRTTHRARSVLLAIGRRGTPAKLGVPGEEQPHVVYRLVDPAQYRRRRMVVIGGGDSALEAALALAAEGATSVALAHRSESFSRAKRANRERLDRAVKEGQVQTWMRTTVRRIEREAVVLAREGVETSVPADGVIVCAGGVLPGELLRALGITLETRHGAPVR